MDNENTIISPGLSENEVPGRHRLVTKLRLKDAFTIFIGATLLTIAVKYIFDPSGLVTGGVSGLSIVVKYLSDLMLPIEIPLWVTNVALNVPIFIFAMIVDGKRSIIRTGLAFLINSAELFIFPDIDAFPFDPKLIFPFDNLFLVSLFGGIVFGLSSGILLSVRATSGGTDLLGKALHRKFRGISMGRMIQILDGLVVIAGLITFGIERTLYAIVSVYVMGKITDLCLDRGKTAKMCLIFTKATKDISATIMSELDRGCTGLHATGMYSGENRTVLLCVCTKNDLPDVKDIVKEYDKKAFFIVANISEAMGEGFAQLRNGNAL